MQFKGYKATQLLGFFDLYHYLKQAFVSGVAPPVIFILLYEVQSVHSSVSASPAVFTVQQRRGIAVCEKHSCPFSLLYQRKPMDVILLDFIKAFSTVFYSIHLNKMSS